MADELHIDVPDEHIAGVWANAVELVVGDDELTLDFVRLNFATGRPPTHGRVVARVACSPALVGRLVTLASHGLDEYTSRLGREPLDGGSLDL